jgi:fructose-bisphosphate aldolase class II
LHWWLLLRIYAGQNEPTGDVLRIDRIKEIHARIPDTHLVMHGSSSVPQDWLEIINNHGGDMGQTYGVPVNEITSTLYSKLAGVFISASKEPSIITDEKPD